MMPFTPTVTPEIERAHGAPLHIIVRAKLREGLSTRQVAAELGYKSHNAMHYALAKQGWTVTVTRILVKLPRKGVPNKP